MLSIPGLTNSGTMPIDAGGGAAGPSGVKTTNDSAFRVGDINMGGGQLSGVLPVLLAVAVVWFLVAKVG